MSGLCQDGDASFLSVVKEQEEVVKEWRVRREEGVCSQRCQRSFSCNCVTNTCSEAETQKQLLAPSFLIVVQLVLHSW